MRRLLFILAALLCPLAHGATIACITTPGTYDATLGASWVGGTAPNIAGGDLITCATSGVKEIFSTNYIIGNSPASGTKVINFTGGSTVGPGHNAILKVLGDLAASNFSEAAGSEILFDSTGAGSPTSTPYTLTTNSFVQDASFPTSNTTGNIFSITANPSGTNWRWAVATAGSGISGLANFNFSQCGDSGGAAKCLPYVAGGSGVVAIGPGTFDTTCGIGWSSLTANDGFNLSGVTFKNTYSACVNFALSAGAVRAGGVACSFTNMVFDLAPTIETPGAGCVWTGPIFFNGYNNGAVPAAPGTMSYAWYRNTTANGNLVAGAYNWDHSFIFQDNLVTYSAGQPQNPTPAFSGTITSCTANSFTDSSASFPSTIVESGGGGWSTAITTGADAFDAKLNKLVTSGKTITMFTPWKTTCSPGDHYAIYNGILNPHAFSNISVSFGTSISFDWIMGWFHGADASGDFIHSANTTGINYRFHHFLVMPNVARSNSYTLITGGTATGTLQQYDMCCSTYFVGEQGASLCEGCTNNTGVVSGFFDMLAWQDPTVNYASGLGQYMVGNSIPNPVTSSNFIDEIKRNCGVSGTGPCGDFNWVYGIPGANATGTRGFCASLFGGSTAYDLNCSGPLGPNDVANFTSNPGFPNPWASPLTWTCSLGAASCTGDTFQVLATTLTQMMNVNDPSGHIAGFTPQNFFTYMYNSMAFTNPVGHGTGGSFTGADGSDMGFGPYLPPAVTNFNSTNTKWSGTTVIQ